MVRFVIYPGPAKPDAGGVAPPPRGIVNLNRRGGAATASRRLTLLGAAGAAAVNAAPHPVHPALDPNARALAPLRKRPSDADADGGEQRKRKTYDASKPTMDVDPNDSAEQQKARKHKQRPKAGAPAPPGTREGDAAEPAQHGTSVSNTVTTDARWQRA